MSKYSYCTTETIQAMVKEKFVMCLDTIMTNNEMSAETKVATIDGVMAMMYAINDELEDDQNDN
jgi:hypothetical protein